MRLLLLEEGHCFREQALSFCRLSSAVPRDLMSVLAQAVADFAPAAWVVALGLDTFEADPISGFGLRSVGASASTSGKLSLISSSPRDHSCAAPPRHTSARRGWTVRLPSLRRCRR